VNPAAQTGHASLAEKAYERLKEQIISVQMRPGSLIREEECADRLGMSRTPVREALKKLEHEGLVRRIPQRGVFVTELSIRDFLEICEVRDLLESHACRIAAEKVDFLALDKFADEFTALEIPDPDDETVRRASVVDREFHQFILESAGNRRIVGIISHLNDVINRLRFALTPSRYHESLGEHRRILEALKARNGAEAEAAMHAHIDAVRKSLHLLH
jgi:DNA-binding GntR family transcriptional regulator